MNRYNYSAGAGWISVVIVLPLIANTAPPDLSYRFGNPLYNPSNAHSPLDAGISYFPTPLQIATWDIRDAGGYLTGAPLFFQPDLVTPGREIYLSGAGAGPGTLKVLWRGRPFRDPWTGLADLGLIAPWQVGGFRATSLGTIGGVASSGGVIDLQPAVVTPEAPVTVLSHREGFYNFAPVEFVHSRPITTSSGITLNGYFPSSAGRFSHAAFTGSSLGGEVSKRFGESELKASYQTIDFRDEMPFSDSVRTVYRTDLDIQYRRVMTDDRIWQVGGYQVGQRMHWNSKGYSAGESGATSRLEWGNKGLYLRVSDLTGRRNAFHHRTELEGAVGVSGNAGALSGRAVLGGSGWLVEGLDPVAFIEGSWNQAALGVVTIQGLRAAQVRTLEMLSARAENNSSGLADSLRLLAELDSLPGTSVVTAGSIGWSRKTPVGAFELSAFGRDEARPLVWYLAQDDRVERTVIDRSVAAGWEGRWSLEVAPYRAIVTAAGFSRRMVKATVGDFLYPEPPFRLYSEVGWHRAYFNDAFEADVLFSGRYFQAYYSPDAGDWERVGGAYPLDFRLTFRIYHFNFYWGVHNWNSYQYYLVPGYKAMHKEEYWGLKWLLRD